MPEQDKAIHLSIYIDLVYIDRSRGTEAIHSMTGQDKHKAILHLPIYIIDFVYMDRSAKGLCMRKKLYISIYLHETAWIGQQKGVRRADADTKADAVCRIRSLESRKRR